MKKERDDMDRGYTERMSDQELDAAFKDLYRKYGNDFQAFMRDVQESLRKQKSDNKERTPFCAL